MNIEKIFEEWEVDSKIDRTELGDAALHIAVLHSKYYKVFISERLLLRKLEADMKQLKLSKYEFYTQGPSKESQDRGWALPAKGMILKQDLSIYMDADKDIIELNLKIAYQMEKIDLLEAIIKSLTNRNFQIKSAIDWTKFMQGS